MITELRRYSVQAGHMHSMHTRMRTVLLPLFREHGVPPPLAIWETDRPEAAMMTWLLRWPSLEVRNATWAGFRPVWEAAKRRDGGEEFVTRTDLTLIDPWPAHSLSFAAAGAACESAWLVQPRVGLGAAFRSACMETRFPAFRNLGAVGIVPCDFMFGPLPQSFVLVSWPDAQVREQGMARIQTDARDRNTDLVAPGAWIPLNRADYLTTWSLSP
jgi:hypothetical protein